MVRVISLEWSILIEAFRAWIIMTGCNPPSFTATEKKKKNSSFTKPFWYFFSKPRSHNFGLLQHRLIQFMKCLQKEDGGFDSMKTLVRLTNLPGSLIPFFHTLNGSIFYGSQVYPCSDDSFISCSATTQLKAYVNSTCGKGEQYLLWCSLIGLFHVSEQVKMN